MQLITLVIALLAGVSEAKRSHHYRLMAADPPSGATCYRGNQKQYPVSGDNTPPCWYAEPDNSYSCYEIDPKTSQCPNFPNKVNKPGNGNNSATCFRGNQKQYPVSGKSTPPCWYKEADGSNSCYEYEPSTGKCPNFPNPISKPSYHLRASGAQKLKKAGGRHKSHLRTAHSTNRYNSKGQKVATKNYCHFTNSLGLEESIKTVGVDKNIPPCWFERDDGQYNCDEDANLELSYDGNCYEEGYVNAPKASRHYRLRNQEKPKADSDTCLFINSWGMDEKELTVGIDSDEVIPQCWTKDYDGTYICPEDVDYDGNCYGDNEYIAPRSDDLY